MTPFRVIISREVIRFRWSWLVSVVGTAIISVSSFLDPMAKVPEDFHSEALSLFIPGVSLLFSFDITHSYFGKRYEGYVKSRPVHLLVPFVGSIVARGILWLSGTSGTLILLLFLERILEGATLPLSSYGEAWTYLIVKGLLILWTASVFASWSSSLNGLVAGAFAFAAILYLESRYWWYGNNFPLPLLIFLWVVIYAAIFVVLFVILRDILNKLRGVGVPGRGGKTK